MSRANDLNRNSAPPSDPTRTPWPYWILRYVATDAQQAMEDLVWSVGGSPPYGGISFDEAAAVYDLLQDYLGPGEASAAAYARVNALLKAAPERLHALAVFQCNDQVTSAPENYTREPVQRGRDLARALGHAGAEATFLSFEAGWHHRQGDLGSARELVLQALERYLELAEHDDAYAKRVRQSAQNAVSFTALSGDLQGARDLLARLGELLEPDRAEELRRALGAID